MKDKVKPMRVFGNRPLNEGKGFKPSDIEFNLIDTVIFMDQGPKGPMFKKMGMRVLFPHKNSKIEPGFVLVRDIILKDRFGFVIGENIKLKSSLTEDEYIKMISENIHEFGYVDVDEKHSDFIVGYQEFYGVHMQLYCISETGTIHKFGMSPSFRNDIGYEVFKTKYFLCYDHKDDNFLSKTIIPKELYDTLWENYAGREEFKMKLLNTRKLAFKRVDLIKNALELNRAENIRILTHLKEVKMREVANEIPRFEHFNLEKVMSRISHFLQDYD